MLTFSILKFLRTESFASQLKNGGNAMLTFCKKTALAGAVVAASAVLCALPVSLQRSPAAGIVLSVDRAQAEVGRPLTPGSVAGVHRRVERRAVRRCAVGVTC